jgi:hypothetical protein
VSEKNRALLEAIEKTQEEISRATRAAEETLSKGLDSHSSIRNHLVKARKDGEARRQLRRAAVTVSATLLESDFFFGLRPPMEERGRMLQHQVLPHRPRGWSKRNRTSLVNSVRAKGGKVLSAKARDLAVRAYSAENNRIKGLSDVELAQEVEPARQGADFWMKVAMRVKRSKEECKLQWMNHDNPLLSTAAWTKEEERRLHAIANKERFAGWVKIAQELGSKRSPADVLQHFQQVYNSTLCRTGPWTEQEDGCLRRAVEQHGSNWVEVARAMQAQALPRSGQQCLHRWRVLDPQKRRGP